MVAQRLARPKEYALANIKHRIRRHDMLIQRSRHRKGFHDRTRFENFGEVLVSPDILRLVIVVGGFKIREGCHRHNRTGLDILNNGPPRISLALLDALPERCLHFVLNVMIQREMDIGPCNGLDIDFSAITDLGLHRILFALDKACNALEIAVVLEFNAGRANAFLVHKAQHVGHAAALRIGPDNRLPRANPAEQLIGRQLGKRIVITGRFAQLDIA